MKKISNKKAMTSFLCAVSVLLILFLYSACDMESKPSGQEDQPMESKTQDDLTNNFSEAGYSDSTYNDKIPVVNEKSEQPQQTTKGSSKGQPVLLSIIAVAFSLLAFVLLLNCRNKLEQLLKSTGLINNSLNSIKTSVGESRDSDVMYHQPKRQAPSEVYSPSPVTPVQDEAIKRIGELASDIHGLRSILEKLDSVVKNANQEIRWAEFEDQLRVIKDALPSQNKPIKADLLLDLHFRDVAQSVRLAFQIAEQEDSADQATVKRLLRDIASLMSFASLSTELERYKTACQIIRDKLAHTSVEPILPLPGQILDPATMDIEKRYADNDRIHTIILPGARVGDVVYKALVNVGQ